ncbi:MAG TPA: hypothetical protein VF989_04620 [Polyangiaceae bacterium]|jgi:hypothetical protein
MAEKYRILDEPEPSRLSRLSVNPFWIFLASMLGGAALGWSWFLFNGFAFGSPTRRREALLVGTGVAGVALLVLAGSELVAHGYVPESFYPYVSLVFVAYKLCIAYLLHLTQSRGFELYTHFGGQAKSGLIVVVLAVVLRVKASQWFGPWAGVFL